VVEESRTAVADIVGAAQLVLSRAALDSLVRRAARRVRETA
jgi:hypothetical protein